MLLTITDEFITSVFDQDSLSAITDTLTKQVQILAIPLAIFLFILMVGYNYAKKALESTVDSDSDGKIVDIKELVRTIVILFFIGIYSIALMPTINGLVRSFNSFTQLDENKQKEMSQKMGEYMKEQEKWKKHQNIQAADQVINDPTSTPQEKELAMQIKEQSSEEENSIISKVANSVEFIGSTPSRVGTWTNGQICNFISGIVKLVVGVLAVLLFKALLIFGPLAFAVSIVPTWRGQVDVWFGTLIGTGMVITTMHIFDALIYGLLSTIWDSKHFTFEDSMIITVCNLVAIILYLRVFWVTSKWVGKGDGGNFVSKTVMLATSAAMMAATGGSSAAASGGGSTLGNVLSTFSGKKGNSSKDMFKDEGGEK